MRFFPVVMSLLIAFATTLWGAEGPRLLEKAQALPLALDDSFQFRKVQTVVLDPELNKKSANSMLSFETQRLNFGAITNVDRYERQGQYFRFFWRTKREANVRVRFEYRQTNLGSYIQAREVAYDGAKGSMKTEFRVTGDDYHTDGRVTSWRALLIENGKVVGLTQSFLWN